MTRAADALAKLAFRRGAFDSPPVPAALRAFEVAYFATVALAESTSARENQVRRMRAASAGYDPARAERARWHELELALVAASQFHDRPAALALVRACIADLFPGKPDPGDVLADVLDRLVARRVEASGAVARILRALGVDKRDHDSLRRAVQAARKSRKGP